MAGHKDDEPLPKVVYSVVDPDALQPAGVHDKVLESFGFNSGQEWSQLQATKATADNNRYLRWIPPMEEDLAKQVEYDLDEQDQLWLDMLNKRRKKEGLAAVPPEVFEIVFDKLEKEWFDLQRRIPKKEKAVPIEDSKCAICEDGECENSNAIVFCDGCNLAVHQDCYGVPYIPEGQWLCRKCTVSPDRPVSCVLCPNSYGAFKQTTNSYWAHLICAIWVPETGVSNTVYMEPIDGIENISKNRWKLVCYICKKRVGACIQCANRTCFTAFHVTCARERGLELRMKNGNELTELKAYCEKHQDSWTPELAQSSVQKYSAQKAARAYKKSYASGPPVVPAFIYDRLLDYTSKLKLAKRQQFVAQLCRYWSLKREARRGAPILKRLHLEPWTASASETQQTDSERAKKLELIRLLRNDLENVRMLTERVRKREKKKLERTIVQKAVVDEFVFSRDQAMADVLERVSLLDKHKIFSKPVSKAQVPDYYDIIKFPMDLSTMRDKLERHEYITAQDFLDDFDLVINNARRYNRSESFVHKQAVRFRELAEPILADLEKLESAEAIKHAVQIESLLTLDFVEQLFNYSFEPVPDEQSSSSSSSSAKKGTSSFDRKRKAVEPVDDTLSSKKRKTRSSAAAPETVDQSSQSGSSQAKKGTAVAAVGEDSVVVLDDVDPKSSFKLFESGWVLPEGSSRRKSAAQPSKPKAVGPSTPSASNMTNGSRKDSAVRSQKGQEQQPSQAPKKTSSSTKDLLKAILRGKHRPSTVPESTTIAPSQQQQHQDTPSKASGEKSYYEQKKEYDAELASLHASVAIKPKDKLEPGTRVWAKAQGFYPFPAETMEPKDLPPATLSHKPQNADRDKLVPVLFFDANRSSAWCSRDNLRLLGKDERVDELLNGVLNVKSVLYKKNASKKGGGSYAKQLRDLNDAYDRATSIEEEEDDDDEDQDQGGAEADE